VGGGGGVEGFDAHFSGKLLGGMEEVAEELVVAHRLLG
jgi:hypothetical protein